jgi:hypothetical protein
MGPLHNIRIRKFCGNIGKYVLLSTPATIVGSALVKPDGSACQSPEN